MKTFICLLLIGTLGVSTALAQQVTKENVPGIGSFARVETTVACAGAIKPESAAAIKKEGFVAIFNLREAIEPGADIEAEAAAAKAAGINYVHIPFNSSKPARRCGSVSESNRGER